MFSPSLLFELEEDSFERSMASYPSPTHWHPQIFITLFNVPRNLVHVVHDIEQDIPQVILNLFVI